MADYEDISGWREELLEFKNSDEGQAYFRRFSVVSLQLPPAVSRQIPIKLAELLLKFPELRSAVDATVKFQSIREKFPNIDDSHPEWKRNPISDNIIIDEFVDWYAMKTQEPYWKFAWWGCALGLAQKVRSGEIVDLKSPEAEHFVLDNWGDSFN